MSKGDVIEENNALMANGVKAAEEPATFKTWLYNKDKGTVCGRNAKSWAQILGFYVVFYACLAAFWIACLACFLSTLDDKVPRFYGKGTIIGINPGLGYQPWLKENPDSTLIRFSTKDPNSYKPYVDQLEEYLSKYQNTNGTRSCSGTQTNKDVFEGKTAEACRFSLDAFEKGGCSKANGYGYKDGKPCVVLSLNRLIGWEPVDYPDKSVPAQVDGRYKKGNVAMFCDGTNVPDKEHVGAIKYLPEAGMDKKYYPYSLMDNYHQPIAMVQFASLPHNQVVMVECRAYAYNIQHDITAKLGLVQFELFIDSQSKKPAA